MPTRRFNFQDEISLRHLPDTSDSSFSFQIPHALSGNDRLLDENDMSFFGDTNDVDVNSATPGPGQSTFKALSLEELTSRPASKVDRTNHHNYSTQPMPAYSGSQASLNPTLRATEQALVTRTARPKGKLRPNLKVSAQSTQTSAEVESSVTEALRGEIQVVDNAAPGSYDPPPPTNTAESLHPNESRALSRQERPVMKTERPRKKTVISGGIVKMQSKKAASSSKLAHNVSVPAIQQETLLPPEIQSRVVSDYADFGNPGSPDISICSTAPGGVAERLVMYSQTLLSSCGPAVVHDPDSAVPVKDDPELSTQRRNSIADNINAHHTGDRCEDPLTLSQLSPSKTVSSHPFPPATVLPNSPMRQPTKRPASVSSSPQPVAKKGRNLASAIIAPAARSDGHRAPTKSSSSGSGSRRAQRTIRPTSNMHGVSKRTRHHPVSTCTIPENSSQGDDLSRSDTTSSSSGHNSLRFSRSDDLATSGTSDVQGQGEAGSSRSTGMSQSHERVVPPPANTTKAVDFKSQIDARIEARKAEFEKERLFASQKPRKQYSHQVPDFKTLHAAEEARLALRKENIVPTVPLPFQLSTDGRAREREKFDEHVREKEQELKRVLEQKRRDEEETEERVIRELRKKAVPRAHEVPEWYKDVPKRKMRGLDMNKD